MVLKEWVAWKANAQKLPVEERLKQAEMFLKKAKNKELKKEIQVFYEQVQIIAEWHKLGFARVEAMHLAQQSDLSPENVFEEEFAITAVENLEELVNVPSLPDVNSAPLLNTESLANYSPSASYVPGTMYGPATSYNAAEYSVVPDSVSTHIMAEQSSAVQVREREEKEKRAVGSDQSALENRDFYESKSKRSQK